MWHLLLQHLQWCKGIITISMHSTVIMYPFSTTRLQHAVQQFANMHLRFGADLCCVLIWLMQLVVVQRVLTLCMYCFHWLSVACPSRQVLYMLHGPVRHVSPVCVYWQAGWRPLMLYYQAAQL